MPSPYSSRYYEGLKEDSATSARAVVPLVLRMFPARSVVDVGCGSGTWARAYAEAGCEVLGIEGHVVRDEQLLIPPDRFERARADLEGGWEVTDGDGRPARPVVIDRVG